jgi:cellulose synthase/poly-beta-1,6-N-acetylglucosamine synthase-like glycosyltransferase
MKYENKLRELETMVGSIVGVDGAIDAVRASLYQPMPEHLQPDFLLPLQVLERGYRVVYEPDAFVYEASLQECGDEVRMRVRVILRSLHTMWYMKKLFNPLRFGVFSFQLLVHKVLRYLVGLLQVIALFTNALIVWDAPVFQLTMAMQLGFYSFAVAGFALARFRRRVSLFYYSYYLCLLNGASLVALWKFLKGEQRVIWAPRTG